MKLNHATQVLAIAASLGLLSACGSVGDTSSVKEANKLAVACKTNEALAAVDRAAGGGGLASHIADLQRVVILRDAGRVAEADAAMARRNKQPGIDAESAAKAERSVAESIEQLRAERLKKTGRATCP